MLEADRLPEPPENLPAPLDLAEEALSAWRLHWEENPLHMRSHPTGRFRFDTPSGEYRSLYCNADRLAAFAEVYGDVRVIDTDQKCLRLSRILSREKLLLIPLDEPTTQKRLGLDGRIGMSRQYPTTQRWALSLFRWFPEAHGLRYLSRYAGEHRNYCVFVDRCAGKLSSEEHGTMSSLRDLVLLAADTYYLEVHWDGKVDQRVAVNRPRHWAGTVSSLRVFPADRKKSPATRLLGDVPDHPGASGEGARRA